MTFSSLKYGCRKISLLQIISTPRTKNTSGFNANFPAAPVNESSMRLIIARIIISHRYLLRWCLISSKNWFRQVKTGWSRLRYLNTIRDKAHRSSFRTIKEAQANEMAKWHKTQHKIWIFTKRKKKFERLYSALGRIIIIFTRPIMNGSKKNHRKSYRAQRFGVYVWFITNEEYDRIERKRKGQKKNTNLRCFSEWLSELKYCLIKNLSYAKHRYNLNYWQVNRKRCFHIHPCQRSLNSRLN